MDEEDVRTTKQDYYLAQIAQAHCGGRLTDYLLRFRRDAPKPAPQPSDWRQIQAGFAAWLGRQ